MNMETQNNTSQGSSSIKVVETQSAKKNKARARKNNKARHKAMVGFIYPAILGSTLYGIFDYGLANGTDYFNPEFWLRLGLVLMIIFLYYSDMRYSNTCKIAQNYSRIQFVSEIFVVLTLFPAVQVALGLSNYEVLLIVPLAFIFFIKKVACLFWEYASVKKDAIAINTDLSFIMLYVLAAFVMCCCSPLFGWVVTLIVIVADCLVYMFWPRFENYFLNKKSVGFT